jgi:hypothetical protein
MVTRLTAGDRKNQLANRATYQSLGRCKTDPALRNIEQYNRGP